MNTYYIIDLCGNMLIEIQNTVLTIAWRSNELFLIIYESGHFIGDKLYWLPIDYLLIAYWLPIDFLVRASHGSKSRLEDLTPWHWRHHRRHSLWHRRGRRYSGQDWRSGQIIQHRLRQTGVKNLYFKQNLVFLLLPILGWFARLGWTRTAFAV